MTYIVVLLTTIYFNSMGSAEIHVTRQPTVAVCRKQRNDWPAKEDWRDVYAPYAFKPAGFYASCKATIIGRRAHV